MPHSELFGRVAGLMRVGAWAAERGIPAADALRAARVTDQRAIDRHAL